MRYVLAIIFIIFVAIGFAAYGVKSPLAATQRDAEPEATATRLDHIREELEATRNVDQCALFLKNEANTLRQVQR